MAHESHDNATAAKLRQLARRVRSDYCWDQLLRIAQGFDRLPKHAEEWRLAPSAGVDRDVRGRETAGDHAPAWIELEPRALPRRARRLKMES
jgi:hypothetical protein